jgi:P-type conjugative transfer protein TrbJ
MSKSKFLRASTCAALIAAQTLPAFLPSQAYAGALTGGSTEWTQIANNFQLIQQVYKQIETVKKLADSYIVQYQSLQQQILNGIQIEGISLADVLKAKNDIEEYQRKLKALGADIEGLGDYFDTRLTEAKLLKLPMEEYIKREAKKVEEGNKTAKARLDRERTLMQQVKSDISRVDEFSNRISSTLGTHQATQLLNSQMNLLLQQMGRMVEMTAEQQGSDQARTLNEEAEARQRWEARSKAFYETEQLMRERDAAGLGRMQGYK